MNIAESQEYQKQLVRFISNNILLQALQGKTILLTGATGMIGSFLVDVLMHRNQTLPTQDRVNIIALARNRETACERFSKWMECDELSFVSGDIAYGLPELNAIPDYYIHAASTTHPLAYASEPVNTVLANVFGINSILNHMAKIGKGRLLLLSSVEIYGENRGDTEQFSEEYCGYINCNTLRAGYPEAKRVSESLCQAYIKQHGIDAVIIRLPRTYGPTMRMSDSKASAQFIMSGLKKEDIVLKSAGTQFFSYAHTFDVVSGMLSVLLKGECGKAYNLGSPDSDITLKDMAALVASYAGTKVIFELPNSTEKAGFSTATKAILDGSKLRELGWVPHYNIRQGLEETMRILQELMYNNG